MLWLPLIMSAPSLAGSTQPPPVTPDRVIHCSAGEGLLKHPGAWDDRIDGSRELRLHYVDHQVVGAQFTPASGALGPIVQGYGWTYAKRRLWATPGETQLPVRKNGDTLSVGHLSAPPVDSVSPFMDTSVAGCWLWDKTGPITLHRAEDGTQRAWLGEDAHIDGIVLPPDARRVPTDGGALPPLRLEQPAWVLRARLANRPEVAPSTGPKPMNYTAMADLLQIGGGWLSEHLRRCEPWTGSAVVLDRGDMNGFVLFCPGGDAAVVDEVVRLANHAPIDLATQTDGVWTLGSGWQTYPFRYAVADASGYWLASDLELLKDARNNKGRAAWGSESDAPGIVLQAPTGATARLELGGDGVVRLHDVPIPSTDTVELSRLGWPGRTLTFWDDPHSGPFLPTKTVWGPPGGRAQPCTSPDECASEADRLILTSGDPMDALNLARGACSNGSALGCYAQGWLLVKGEADMLDPATGVRVLRKGCSLGEAQACSIAAWALRNGENPEKATSDIAALVASACRLGATYSCGEAALDKMQAGQPLDAEIVSMMENACRANDDTACLNLSEALLITGDRRGAERLLSRSSHRDEPDGVFYRAMLRLQLCLDPECVAAVARSWDRLPHETRLTWDWADVIEHLGDRPEAAAMERLLTAADAFPRDTAADVAFYGALEAVVQAAGKASSARSTTSFQGRQGSGNDDFPASRLPPCIDEYTDVKGSEELQFELLLSMSRDAAQEDLYANHKDMRTLTGLAPKTLFFCGAGRASPQVLRQIVHQKQPAVQILGVNGPLQKGGVQTLAGFGGDRLYLASPLGPDDVVAFKAFAGKHLSLRGVQEINPAGAEALASVSKARAAAARTAMRSTLAQSHPFAPTALDVQAPIRPLSLVLDRLQTLDAESARNLSRYQGGRLSLKGLTALEPGVAKALGTGFRGVELDLSGLASLSVEDAAFLADSPVSALRLNGIRELDAQTARALGRFRGAELDLSGLKALSKEAAAGLAVRARTHARPVDLRPLSLRLDGLTSLAPDVATHLQFFAASQLSLNGLKTLDVATAKLLFSQERAPSVTGLESIEHQVAALIYTGSADRDLRAVRVVDPELVSAGTYAIVRGASLTPTSARVVCDRSHGLTIELHTEPGIELAHVLGTCEASLDLRPLDRLSPAAASALTRFFTGPIQMSADADFGPKTRQILTDAGAQRK